MTTRTSSTAGKSSSESTMSGGGERWSQRRLQRLNTEQGFREQRQGASAQQAPPHPSLSSQQAAAYQRSANDSLSYGSPSPVPVSASNSPNLQYNNQQSQQSHQEAHGPGPQVHIPTHTTQQQPNPSAAELNSNNYQTQTAHSMRQLRQARSFSQTTLASDSPIAVSNDNSQAALGRQSNHANGSGMNSNSTAGQNSHLPAAPMPALPSQLQSSTAQAKDTGRSTPQMMATEDMTDEDIVQLVNDHKELRK